jgi:type IV secretory pathway TraG/TraD family ATPase VirD4
MIRPLAEAWREVLPERMFSFRDWVHQDNPRQPKIVVVQRSGRHPEISAMWIGMALDAIASHVGNPAFDVSQTRSRTLAIDELPSLGRLRRLPELLDTGRNKGLNMIAAAQDINVQFDRVYGDFAESIKLRFRLKIFCAQTPGPQTTEVARNTIGLHRVEEITYDKTVTWGPQGRTEQVASNRRIDEVPIVSEHYLAHQLGIRGNRVRAILVGLPEVLQFDWPLRVWRKRR